jgi:hypothetical protein
VAGDGRGVGIDAEDETGGAVRRRIGAGDSTVAGRLFARMTEERFEVRDG